MTRHAQPTPRCERDATRAPVGARRRSVFGGFKTYRGAGGALLHFPGLRNTSDRAFSFCLIPLHPNRTHFMQEYLFTGPKHCIGAARGSRGFGHKPCGHGARAAAFASALRDIRPAHRTSAPQLAARSLAPLCPGPLSPPPPSQSHGCATAVACCIARRVAPVPALPLTLRAAPPATAAHLAAAWHR